MKGIILAGGYGTRLYPVTKVISKQLLPVYDKPMIYYPLSVLMRSNIREILIISTPKDINFYQELLGDGSQLGISLTYKLQDKPRGLADAFVVGETFIGKDDVALILGDNIFWGESLNETLNDLQKNKNDALIFAYPVSNPSEFGVVEFDDNYNVLTIEEKPIHPKSKFAVPGLYFYPNDVVDIAKDLEASTRGELEITDVNRAYLKQERLKTIVLPEDIMWFDTGSHEGLLQASCYIQIYQEVNHHYIGCIEEIAYLKKYITDEQLRLNAESLLKNEYGKYLLSLLERKVV